MNEFGRSNLGIQPKQRLMTAGSFINPVRTYDSNEQIRIVESFRGLSARTDDLIDGFIKKKQEEGQAKADEMFTEALENPNHPDHNMAINMLDKQKKEVVKHPNLLSTSYWAQKYLFDAQAEQLAEKEKGEFLLALDKSRNLTPDEFKMKAGEIRRKIEEEVATYPAGVGRAFRRLPRDKMLLHMQDKHFTMVAEKNSELLDTALRNKYRNIMANSDDGIDSIYRNTTISDDTISLAWSDLTPEIRKGLTETAKQYEKVSGRVVRFDKATGEIVDIDDREKVYEYMVVANSDLPDRLIAQMVEAAGAGRTPEQIHTQLVETITSLIQETPDRADELEALYLVTLNKANESSVLQDKVNSWDVTDTLIHSKEIALFDMGQAHSKVEDFKRVAINAAAIQESNYQLEKKKNYDKGMKFFWDLRANGELDDDEVMRTPVAELAKKYGFSLEVYGEALADYQKTVADRNTRIYTQSDLHTKNHYITEIRQGRISNREDIVKAYRNGIIHGNDYKEILNEFETHGGASGSQTRSLIRQSMEYAINHINERIGTINPTLANNAIKQLEAQMWQAYKNGEFSDVFTGYEAADKIIQRLGNLSAFKDLFANPSNPQPDELQTVKQFKQGTVDSLGNMEYDEKEKIASPQIYVPAGITFDEFKQSDISKAMTGLGISEEQVKELFNTLSTQSREKDKHVREKDIRKILKDGNYDIEDLAVMVKERPDIVKEMTGVEMEIVNGVAVPKGVKEMEIYRYYINNGLSINNVFKIFPRDKEATDAIFNIIKTRG